MQTYKMLINFCGARPSSKKKNMISQRSRFFICSAIIITLCHCGWLSSGRMAESVFINQRTISNDLAKPFCTLNCCTYMNQNNSLCASCKMAKTHNWNTQSSECLFSSLSHHIYIFRALFNTKGNGKENRKLCFTQRLWTSLNDEYLVLSSTQTPAIILHLSPPIYYVRVQSRTLTPEFKLIKPARVRIPIHARKWISLHR